MQYDSDHWNVWLETNCKICVKQLVTTCMMDYQKKLHYTVLELEDFIYYVDQCSSP